MTSEAEPARLDIGRVTGRAFAIIRQRWAALGFFLIAYVVLDVAFRSFVHLHYQAGRHDLQLALSIAVYLGFECLSWFQGVALIATALPTSPAPTLSTIGRATRAAVRAFPSLAPFFVIAELPGLTETLWSRWSGTNHLPPMQLANQLILTGFAEMAFAMAVVGCFGVVAPVVIVEQSALWTALLRAWRLLSGSRWRFVAIYIVVTVVAALPALIAGVLALPIVEGAHLVGHSASYVRTTIEIAGCFGSIVAGTWQVMIAATYLDLRRAREGVIVGEVAEVFA